MKRAEVLSDLLQVIDLTEELLREAIPSAEASTSGKQTDLLTQCHLYTVKLHSCRFSTGVYISQGLVNEQHAQLRRPLLQSLKHQASPHSYPLRYWTHPQAHSYALCSSLSTRERTFLKAILSFNCAVEMWDIGLMP